jgi:putative ABC transport system permease protein
LGANVFVIQADQGEAGTKVQKILPRQLDTLSMNLPGCSLARVREHLVPVPEFDQHLTILGTEPSLAAIRQWSMKSGRFLDQVDIQQKDRYAVLPSEMGREFNVQVGDLIHIRRIPFTVIGLIEHGASAVDAANPESDEGPGGRTVFIPHSVAPHWIENSDPPEMGFDAVYVRAPAGKRMDKVVNVAERILAQPDLDAGTFSWVTPDVLLQGLKRLQQTVKLTVGSIAVLCLILGGTTLMSLMVANVQDRIREIGLRRALGATSKDIALLFVVEACIVTASAALVSTFVTHVALWMGKSHFPVPLELGLFSLLVPLVVALLLGAAFSYWPARAAASINPSDALRVE